jgi:hypothetical protein
LRDPAEIAARGAARLGPRHAARDVGGGFLGDVIRELLARFGVCATPSGESVS